MMVLGSRKRKRVRHIPYGHQGMATPMKYRREAIWRLCEKYERVTISAKKYTQFYRSYSACWRATSIPHAPRQRDRKARQIECSRCGGRCQICGVRLG